MKLEKNAQWYRDLADLNLRFTQDEIDHLEYSRELLAHLATADDTDPDQMKFIARSLLSAETAFMSRAKWLTEKLGL